jgi:hypothetical protein
LSIRRSGKVGIVITGSILSVGLDSIISNTSISKVIFLEVSRSLIKTVFVKDVVDQVIPEEEVGDGSVNILNGLFIKVNGEIEDEVVSS